MNKLYDKYILPKVVHWACNSKPTMYQRRKIIPKAFGDVLEIGIGSGLNLNFYDAEKVESLIGIDPSVEIWDLNKNEINELNFDFSFVKAFAEELPFKNNEFDTIVITYSLCTIKDPQKALSEFKRVMKDAGNLLFCEHGIAPDDSVRYWQNTINPVWKRVGGGCNLNKDIPKMIRENGFRITQLDTMYIPGWKPASYNYWGIAQIK
ncbi:MAG: class I SAM-dependent methyltransferase [Bacteroidota bacterium]